MTVHELQLCGFSFTDDVAIDWIGNNLYWTDAVWARIEVMNLDTLYRAEILRTGANTNPRAIAVDPTTRYNETCARVTTSWNHQHIH